MSNSALAHFTLISPNRNSPRNHKIDRISIHCYVGQVTAQSGLREFSSPSKGASCNYVVGYDGSIGLCVPESDRSWCTSDPPNDHRAVTIETASDTTHPYAVTDKAYEALVDLVTDICRRNGAKKLVWFGDKNKTLAYTPKSGEMVMTVHRWFSAKACPGDYLYERHGAIAAEVTRRLNESEEKEEPDLTEAEAKKIARQEIEAYFAEQARKPVADWAKTHVETVQKRGIMNGDENGGFRPYSPVTRQELAATMVNALGIGKEPSDWAEEAFHAVTQQGLLDGTMPQEMLTREQFAVVLQKLVTIISEKLASSIQEQLKQA